MDIINVNLKQRSYPIYITKDYDDLGMALEKAGKIKKLVIITDENVFMQQWNGLKDELTKLEIKYEVLVLEPGEKNKNLRTMEIIYSYLHKLKLDRKSTIAAFGGGVVGDMTGFAAATYLRGINFIQIPTTLLAQADSSVGGKTGIDFEKSKNIVGAFYQPKFVYINVNTLKTLPKSEIRNGLAETIKHGIILDEDFFIFVRRSVDLIFSNDEETMLNIARNNCRIKSSIVERDETESGIRAFLNLGHTFGHAIETIYDFKYSHGECVALGIMASCYTAEKMGLLLRSITDDIRSTLVKIGLPTFAEDIDVKKVFNQMFLDKKVSNDILTFILPVKIGKVKKQKIRYEAVILEALTRLKHQI